MWQLLYMFEFIPDMIWHIVLIISALMLFITAFFSFVPYRLPLGILSGFILSLTLWIEGGIANEAKWQAEIDKMKVALAEAEKNATQKNVEIQEKIVYKDKIIKEKGAAQIQYIDRIVQGDAVKETIVKDMTPEQRAEYEKKIVELQNSIKNCPVPKIVVEEHNKAAIKTINDAEKGAAQIQYIDRIVQGDTIKGTIVKDMTPEQRAEYEKKIVELQNSIKNCPVPKIVVEEHNKAAIKTINDAARGEKK